MTRKDRQLTPEQRGRFRECVTRQCEAISRLLAADAAGSRVPDFLLARSMVVMFRLALAYLGAEAWEQLGEMLLPDMMTYGGRCASCGHDLEAANRSYNPCCNACQRQEAAAALDLMLDDDEEEP